MKIKSTAYIAAAGILVLSAGMVVGQKGPQARQNGATASQSATCPYGGVRVTGSVKSIDTQKGILTIESSGKTAIVALAPKTLLKSGATSVSLSDLKVGQTVSACGEMAGNQLNANMVNVMYRGQSGPGGAGNCKGAGAGGGQGMGCGAGMGRGRGQGRGQRAASGQCQLGASGAGPGVNGTCPMGQQTCGKITAIDTPSGQIRIDTGTGIVQVRTNDTTILKSGPDEIAFSDLTTGQSVCAAGTLTESTLDASVINVRYSGR